MLFYAIGFRPVGTADVAGIGNANGSFPTPAGPQKSCAWGYVLPALLVSAFAWLALGPIMSLKLNTG